MPSRATLGKTHWMVWTTVAVLAAVTAWLAPAPSASHVVQSSGLGRTDTVKTKAFPFAFEVAPPNTRIFYKADGLQQYLATGSANQYVSIPLAAVGSFLEFDFTAPGYETEVSNAKIMDPSGLRPTSVRCSLHSTSMRITLRDLVRFHPFSTASLLLIAVGIGEVRRRHSTQVHAQLHRGLVLAEITRSGDDGDRNLGARIGPYRLVDRLGFGGMATVYKACLDESLTAGTPPEYVALKLMNAELSKEDSFQRRFRREVKIGSQLLHPHIVRTLDFGDHNGLLYMVMELVKGKTMRDLAAGKRHTVTEAFNYLAPLCEGVAYAHQMGIVHRDLKPENIMIDDQGVLKIMDFGLAQDKVAAGATRLTQTGTTLGTPAYMAPEQAESKEAAAASDQYAIGCICYELLAGDVPFTDPSPVGILMKHLTLEPTPLRDLPVDIDPRIDTVVLRMLAKQPDKRYGTVLEALNALQAIAGLRLSTLRPLVRPPMDPSEFE